MTTIAKQIRNLVAGTVIGVIGFYLLIFSLRVCFVKESWEERREALSQFQNCPSGEDQDGSPLSVFDRPAVSKLSVGEACWVPAEAVIDFGGDRWISKPSTRVSPKARGFAPVLVKRCAEGYFSLIGTITDQDFRKQKRVPAKSFPLVKAACSS